ncbi:MAG TPA: phage tail sheath C-terminal domain-containing protein [Bacteroidia bacterium]
MLKQRTVPGVYIQELNAFPDSVVEVATAVPVFIGYTQFNNFQGNSLKQVPTQINSLTDFIAMFESDKTQNPPPSPGPNIQYSITPLPKPVAGQPTPVADITINGKGYIFTPVASSLFYMYNSIRLYFQNGGATCYVMSIGTYSNEGANGPQPSDFGDDVFTILKGIEEPTMVLIPDALLFSKAVDYYTLMNNCLAHCGDVQSRMTLIDAYKGDTVTDALTFNALAGQTDPATKLQGLDPVSMMRNNLGENFLNYGACYYPWLNTNVVGANEISFNNIVGGFGSNNNALLDTDPVILAHVNKLLGQLKPAAGAPPVTATTLTRIHNALLSISPNYQSIMQTLSQKVNCLPVTPAVAGCICMVDGTQGVWKAPANVSLNAVQSPVLTIDDLLQDNMNVDPISGKSVNAIRSFRGLGVLIWGARTLEGNSQDWRYISVRRTLIMIEQSIKLAARNYVFQANDSSTWSNLQSEIENFLTNIWKQGGLAGAKPEEAFSVNVGLGSTMTAQDILDGYLDVAVLVAVTHPAEFIEISFKQQIQLS